MNINALIRLVIYEWAMNNLFKYLQHCMHLEAKP